jgi:hypothetical protein
MYQLDRFVAIVRPHQPFLDWLNGVPDLEALELSLEQIQSDCTALIIPEFDDEDEAVAFVCKLWEDLFEAELGAWTEDRALWPQKRSMEIFIEWFAVEIHTTVVEIEEGETGTG